MELAFAVLEWSPIGPPNTKVNRMVSALEEHERHVFITRAAITLERLFLWEEDLLGMNLEFGYLLCRSLPWFDDIIETVRLTNGEPKPYITELWLMLKHYLAGDEVDQDLLDDAPVMFLTISEAIWGHFIQQHIALVDE